MGITDEQLQELVDSTLKWSAEVSEMWVGTPYQSYIDNQSKALNHIVKNDGLEASRDTLFNLAQFLHQAELEYGGEGGEY